MCQLFVKSIPFQTVVTRMVAYFFIGILFRTYLYNVIAEPTIIMILIV